ncbi:MAG: hypothetical protein E6I96_16385 [Chloroflexi bacterium]|nr:MAG: hypothetical protein E6I96_16385 [Chloroflexota bacterium]
MKITLVSAPAAGLSADALAIPVATGQRLGPAAQELDQAMRGHAASASVCNDDAFWTLVEQASREAGDRVWRLPIYADYRILLRSQIADLRNAEYGEAGTIMGGMFIAEFAGAKPWAHIDIAAAAWNTNLELTTVLRGPSGAGTRLCIELAELMAGVER